jgi:Z1 domain
VPPYRCSKGNKSLTNVAKFLRALSADRYPAIIFDDEGDQASLDTNTRKRAKQATSGVLVGPSPINDIIQNKLRPAVQRHVYVSVTGTPQAVLLQSADSSHRPSFIKMLPAAASYVGGNEFFSEDEPEDNQRLITLVDRNEKQLLLNPRNPIPAGLRSSILFFLVSAAAAIKNIGLQPHGYSYLCHPSLKNDEQAKAEARIDNFLTEVLDALLGGVSANDVLDDLEAAHTQLSSTLDAQTPSFDEVKKILRDYLPLRRLLTINAKVKRNGINYGKGLNFLIGGNTLGRGIAIRDLLVTYYIREAKVSQIDTMHQHARMYGYRSVTIEYTRLFIPKHLYYRFRDIYSSDEDLRAYIERHAALPATFPVEYTSGLRATRLGVLDAKKIDTIVPGKQVFPNYIVLPQPDRVYEKALGLVRGHFGFTTESVDDIVDKGRQGVMIDPMQAAALINPIKTRSRNIWRDNTIAEIIRRVSEKFGNQVMFRFRTAERTVGEDGFISTGMLFGGAGGDLLVARAARVPTLWVMSVPTRAGSADGAGLKFMYPTLVVPDSYPTLFMFNRGE